MSIDLNELENGTDTLLDMWDKLAEKYNAKYASDQEADTPAVIISPEEYNTAHNKNEQDQTNSFKSPSASVDGTNYENYERRKEIEAKHTAFIDRRKEIIVFAIATIIVFFLAICAVRSCSSETAKTAATAQIIYIGNKNSKVFHKPTCANLPMKKNQREFTSRSAAVNAGYRPCQNCDP